MKFTLKILIVLLFVTCIVSLSVWYFIRNIQGNYVSFDQLPRIEWGSVVRGKGKVPLLMKYRYIEYINPSAAGDTYRLSFEDKVLDTYGRVGPSLVPKKFKGEDGLITYAFARPYQLLGYFASSIGDKDIVVMYIGWKNQDNSQDILSYVVPREQYENEIFLDRMQKYIESIVVKNPLMPITHINDMKTCLSLNFDNQGYCDWYFENKKIIEDNAKIWLESGILPKNMYKYPLLIR